ncbi:MalY/PatB family protein [uncultured Dubosiella sp.]|uniref:MalY/PatB family protein n=1 Tax=uncultured Dubosiella sp. TaxID=1937011 RepID=UPI0025B54C24|nr:aminotransferase class I/II-fold pyridoxal phosphate-dependent enzyme [uncultured Dubosiella sp.]
MNYDFNEVINRKGTYCTQWDYVQDRFGEKDLLPFTISDTDFKIPVPITEKIKEVAAHEIYGYTRWNHADFKNSIAGHYGRRFNTPIQKEWILYSPSVMYSVSLLIRFLSEEGDSVLTFDPMYDAFMNVIEQNHRKLIGYSLNAEEGWSIDFERLDKELEGASILLLCSPHNPTGRVWTKEEMDQIVRLCKKHRVKIISDEIHMDIHLQGEAPIPLLRYIDEYDGLYTASAASKIFNVPGLIGSYVMIPDEAVRNAFLHQTRTMDFLNSASIFGMHAIMTGYNECDDYIDQLSAYVFENMKFVHDFLASQLLDFQFEIPQATYLAWIDVSNVPFGAKEMQEALVKVGNVAVMNGEVYGKNGKGYLRLNCGCPRAKLEEGLRRVKIAMDSLYDAKRKENADEKTV